MNLMPQKQGNSAADGITQVLRTVHTRGTRMGNRGSYLHLLQSGHEVLQYPGTLLKGGAGSVVTCQWQGRAAQLAAAVQKPEPACIGKSPLGHQGIFHSC
jgi:hypothetical protein